MSQIGWEIPNSQLLSLRTKALLALTEMILEALQERGLRHTPRLAGFAIVAALEERPPLKLDIVSGCDDGPTIEAGISDLEAVECGLDVDDPAYEYPVYKNIYREASISVLTNHGRHHVIVLLKKTDHDTDGVEELTTDVRFELHDNYGHDEGLLYRIASEVFAEFLLKHNVPTEREIDQVRYEKRRWMLQQGKIKRTHLDTM